LSVIFGKKKNHLFKKEVKDKEEEEKKKKKGRGADAKKKV